MRDEWKNRFPQIFRGWGYSLAVALLVALSFRSAVAEFNDVPTGSMKPTILEGDRLLVNKLAYDLKVPLTLWRLVHWDSPRRGDIVVFFSPVDGKRLVKRVVGIPGDSIAIRDNRLFMNGEPVRYDQADPIAAGGMEAGRESGSLYFTEVLEGNGHLVALDPAQRSLRSFGPVKVPEGRYFMLGDNRDNSADSRYFGFVDRDLIVGRAVGVFFSLKPDEHYLPRWHRFFKSLS